MFGGFATFVQLSRGADVPLHTVSFYREHIRHVDKMDQSTHGQPKAIGWSWAELSEPRVGNEGFGMSDFWQTEPLINRSRRLVPGAIISS